MQRPPAQRAPTASQLRCSLGLPEHWLGSQASSAWESSDCTRSARTAVCVPPRAQPQQSETRAQS